MSTAVRLIEVDAGNWRAAAAVTPAAGQERFVAPVTYYLCLCHYGTVWHPLAVEAGGDVVGFVMWGLDDSDGSHWVGGLVIDAAHQRRGLGRATVEALAARLAGEPGFREVALSYSPENSVARSLYAAMGFVETGELEGDEVVARLSDVTALPVPRP